MNRINNLKQFFSIPVLVIGCILTVLWAVFLYDQTAGERERQLNQLGHMQLQRIQRSVERYIHISERMANYVVKQGGKTDGFEGWALPFFSKNRPLRTIQLAPDGIVTDVYPMGLSRFYLGNLNEGSYKELAEQARKRREPEVKPLNSLERDKQGVLFLYPVYIFNPYGGERFWGYSIVTVDQSDFLEEINISTLDTMGIQSEILWDSMEDENGNDMVMYSEGAMQCTPMEVKQSIHGNTWTVRLAYRGNWENRGLILFAIWSGLLSTFLVSFLIERTQKLKKISTVDALTGVYNRKGGDEAAAYWLKKEKHSKFMVMALDIDNFKFLNDVYGHDAGDQALKKLVSDIRQHFEMPLVLTRNGGDEFIIMKSYEEEGLIREKIRLFSVTPHRLNYAGKPIDFYTSLGCASYPDQDTDYKKLCIKADFALYNAKINGKAGWRKYDESLLNLQERVQLGFKLSDITENIPGAIIVYRADKNTQILFASDTLISLTGCSSWDDFIHYTQGEFKSIVLPEDRKYLETERNHQRRHGEKHNDKKVVFISYRIQSKDGGIHPVMAAAHYSMNNFHGGIFYVSLFEKRKVLLKEHQKEI